MRTDLKTFCMTPSHSIRDAIARMDENRQGIILVVSDAGRLQGTVTDGDIRRAMLADIDLTLPVFKLVERKAGTLYEKPITAPTTADTKTRIALLHEHNILHLPITDSEGRVVGLVTRDEFLPGEELPLHAVIMAGGFGTRLMPLTEEIPKPMLQVGDRPLLEIIVGQLRDAGIRRVHVTTHHMPDKISNHFGNGEGFGVEMQYVTEDKPLGTAGALGLMNPPSQTMLVINGDILTGVDVRRLLAFHREQSADLTVAVRQYDIQLPYGLVECDGAFVRRLHEKPLVKHYVNAGIYLLEPTAYQYIPNGERFDMTEWIQRLLDAGRPVASFPVREYWLDIGQHEDYQKAQEQVKDWNHFDAAGR
jgi:dTDP-glucose pyrophosphorylase/CBS domain-containing protein